MPQTFAIIPAAGHSVRMGQPKLLLALGGQPLIRHTIDAWLRSSVTAIVVIVRSDDAALATVVRELADPRITLVEPAVPPPDMKASIQAALTHVEQHFHPANDAAFLVAPADMPALSPAIVDLLLDRHLADPNRILVPTLAARRGHPVLFPWQLASEVHALGATEGLNAIVHRHLPLEAVCDHLPRNASDPFADVDTPQQYQRLQGDEP